MWVFCETQTVMRTDLELHMGLSHGLIAMSSRTQISFLIILNSEEFYSLYSKFWKFFPEDSLYSPFSLSLLIANCFLCRLQSCLRPPYFPFLYLVFFWFGITFTASLIRKCTDFLEKYRIRGWKVLIFTLRFYNKSLRCLNNKNKRFLCWLLLRK